MADEPKPEFEEEAKGPAIDPKVKEVYDKLRTYASAPERRKWLKRRDEAWKGAIENEQWDEKEKQELQDQDMVPLVINKLNKGVQASCAMATYKKPDAVFLPIGSNDLYVAELLKRAHDYNWAVNLGTLVAYDVVEESKLGGIGFFDAYWDANKGIMGKIVMEEADPSCVYWDSKARKRDFSDTDIIKARLRTRKYIKENYEGITDKDLEMKFSLDDAQTTEGVTTGDNYKEFEGEEQTRNDKKGDGKEAENVWEIQALLLVTAKEDWVVTYDEAGNPTTEELDPEVWEKEEKKDSSGRVIVKASDGRQGFLWKRTYEKREYRLIVGKKLVEEEANPFGLDSDRDPVINIVPVRHQRTRSSYPMSPTNYALPINKSMNKREAQAILHASHNVNGPIIEPEGTKWRDRKNRESSPGTPGTTGTVPKTAAFMPQRLAPGAAQVELFTTLAERSARDIDQQYDTPPMLKGEVPQGMDPSGRAVLALQDMAGVMGTPYLTTFEGGVVGIAKVLTYLSLKHWTRGMWRRLIEEKEWNDETIVDPQGEPGAEQPQQPTPMPQSIAGAPPQEQPKQGVRAGDRWREALDKIRPEDPAEPSGVDLVDLDVRVLAGSSMPTNRIARQQVALELKNAGVYDAEAVLDYTDDPARDKILPRIRAMEQEAANQAAMKQAAKGK